MLAFWSAMMMLPSVSFIAAVHTEADNRVFPIGSYRAYSISGPTGLRDSLDYISFAGDFGLRRWTPSRELLEEHTTCERDLLSNFDENIVNLEFGLGGVDGSAEAKAIDESALQVLIGAGYSVINVANNHAVDSGPTGLEYTVRVLERMGFGVIGLRASPVHSFKSGTRNIVIFGATDYLDHDDPDGVVLTTGKQDLNYVDQTRDSDAFVIAFVHLGSMGQYVSPHEGAVVERVIEAGADLVVCTGSHFVKGVVKRGSVTVAYGLGNNLFSAKDGQSEPIGMHFVAGFEDGRLVQTFVVPQWAGARIGKVGPLDDNAFGTFLNTLRDRSSEDGNLYFNDPFAVKRFWDAVGKLNMDDLLRVRPRHVTYAIRFVYGRYPARTIGALVATVAFIVVGWKMASQRGKRRRNRPQGQL